MRFFLLRAAHSTPMYRGFRFVSGWLDRNNPVISGDLRLAGEGVQDISLGLVDREGNPVECTIEPAPFMEEDKPLLNMPEDRRRITRMTFRHESIQPVRIVDTRDQKVLVQIEPIIEYPAFLFSILEELRLDGRAPKGFDNFVETGTLFGHTILHASYWFKKAYTIELSKDLHGDAMRNLAHRENLKCLQGNSGEVLPEVISELEGASCFFLDAHWSGDQSVDWENSKFGGYPVPTARIENTSLSEGERQVPLRHELEHIAKSHKGQALVIIDDWHTAGEKDANFSGEDWSHIDVQAVTQWMTDHPRTQHHFSPTYNRFVWLLNAVD